ENRDAVAGVDTVDRFNDVAATEIGIVVGANCHRFYLFLRTHDVFERRSEFVGEAPMGHQYQANHWILLAGALGAPHERATLTIRSPCARGDVCDTPGMWLAEREVARVYLGAIVGLIWLPISFAQLGEISPGDEVSVVIKVAATIDNGESPAAMGIRGSTT